MPQLGQDGSVPEGWAVAIVIVVDMFFGLWSCDGRSASLALCRVSVVQVPVQRGS